MFITQWETTTVIFISTEKYLFRVTCITKYSAEFPMFTMHSGKSNVTI